jgi:hypothetical protein
MHGSWRQGRRQAAFVENRLLHGMIIGEHSYNRFTRGDRACRRVCDRKALCGKRFGFTAGAIENYHLVTRASQVARHRRTHSS